MSTLKDIFKIVVPDIKPNVYFKDIFKIVVPDIKPNVYFKRYI